MSHREEETPAGRNQHGATGKGHERRPLIVNNIITHQKIKGLMLECLLALAAIPAVLLLLPLFFVLAVSRLIGRAAS